MFIIGHRGVYSILTSSFHRWLNTSIIIIIIVIVHAFGNTLPSYLHTYRSLQVYISKLANVTKTFTDNLGVVLTSFDYISASAASSASSAARRQPGFPSNTFRVAKIHHPGVAKRTNSYTSSFDNTHSPMTSPHTGTPSLLAPAFKTNLTRAKSKRWVEAKTVDYGGGGWGDDEDFDDDDPYGDDGYGAPYGAGSSTQGAGARIGSFDRVDDTPAPAPPKLSELGRPKGGIVIPRVETHSPALAVPLPPTPLELEQSEQIIRQNSLGTYFNPTPQQSQGGILKSFLPQIITSRSSSPARPLVRAQTMGFDKPLPLPVPQRSMSPPPPPPPAKEVAFPPVGYAGGLAPKAPESSGKDNVSQPARMGHEFSTTIPTHDPPQIGPPSAARYSPDSPGRPMIPPKDTPVEINSLPPRQNSASVQAALPSLPISPYLPPPVVLKDEPEIIENTQLEVLYDSPVSVEQPTPSPPPPPKDELEQMEKEQLPLAYIAPPSVEQYASSPPPPPEVKRVENISEGSDWKSTPLVPVNPSDGSSPPPKSDKNGGIDYEDNHYNYGHEETDNQPANFHHSQAHHQLSRQIYQEGEYADEEYYQPANYQHQVHHAPPQQSHQSSFTSQRQSIASPSPPLSPFYSSTPSPPSLLSSSPPLPSPALDTARRFVRPSDIYARVAEEREKERIAKEEASESIKARRSMDSQASGGISIPAPSDVRLSTDSQRGHLSPEFPPQSRRRSRESIPDLEDNTGSRPISRQGSAKSPSPRNSLSGRSHSRHSSRAESRNGSRPRSRQDLIVRSPSPYPPPTSALPPVPLPAVPVSPDSSRYDARIDELFAEHERRQEEEKRISSWNDDIIAGYGSSTEEVNSIPHQQDSAPLQEWDGEQSEMHHRPPLDMRRSQSSGFKSLVNHAFIREDTLPTPTSPEYPTSPGAADAISPILSERRFDPILMSDTLPSVCSEQMAVSPPLQRSWTQKAAHDETHMALPPRNSTGAERGTPTVVPVVETEGSCGEITEVTPDTPIASQGVADQGASVWRGVEAGQEDKYTERIDDSDARSGDVSPEKNDLDKFLGELERAQTPGPIEDTLSKERQPYDHSSFGGIGTTPAVQFYAHHEESGRQQQQQQQEPLDSSSFGVVNLGSSSQHQGHEKELPQRPQYEQRETEQVQPFDPSSFGVIDAGTASRPQQQQQYVESQHQYIHGKQYEQMPSSSGVVRPLDSPQYQPRTEKQLLQQPQYEQLQQPQHDQSRQSLGHLEQAGVESDRESIGVFGLYDSYWKQEAAPPTPPPPPPSPPPPPLKSPRRPSVPDLTMLLHASSPPSSAPSQRVSLQGKPLPPVTIPDSNTPLDRSVPASASETPDSELMDMMIARRQFLARTQTGFSTSSETEEREEKERKQGEQKKYEREVLRAKDDGLEGLARGVQDKSRPPNTSSSSGDKGIQAILPIRVLGPESEGIEAIGGPTKVIREEPPTKGDGEDGEKTPVQSEFARELVNQFSRPQTLMLKDTMPMPSGLLVMPPMPPRKEGEEHVPEVVNFSVKDDDTDDEESKASLTVANPSKRSISDRPGSSGVEVGRPMQYMDPKDIARLPNSYDRVAAYNQASKAIGATPTGLDNWVRYMIDENKGAELLQLTPAEPKSRPGTSSGWRAQMAARVEDHRHLPSGASATLLPHSDMSRLGQGNLGNGGAQRSGQATPASSVTTTGSSVANAAQGVANAAHNLTHAPAVEKTMDRAKGFFSRLGGKKGKEGKETFDQQQRSASNIPPPPQNIPSPQNIAPPQPPVPAPTGYQKQGFNNAPVAPPQLAQGRSSGFQAPMGHHQSPQSHQGSVPMHGLQHGQQVPVDIQRLQRDGLPIQNQSMQNDLAQMVQRGQIIQQAQLISPAQPAQPPRQPPMTLEDPHSRPRSQPQPQSPQLAIPGQHQQQRSVSATSPVPQQVQQMAVNPVLSYQPVGGPGLQTQPSSEFARPPPNLHIGQDKKEPGRGNPTPTTSVTQSPVQQAQQFPKRSDSLYSKSRFQDLHASSPVTQRPDRSDSLPSVGGQQQRGTRSDSLSRQQESQRLRADSSTLAPVSTTLSDGINFAAHPHNAIQGSVSVPPQLPSYAGERRGQNAFAPREDPEPQQSHLQRVLTPMTRLALDQPPLGAHGGPEPGIVRSQTQVTGPQSATHQENERQRGLIQQDTGGAPQLTPRGSGINSDDEDLYSPPPPKIHTQQPSPPRGSVTEGRLPPQQGYQLGQTHQTEQSAPFGQPPPQEFGRGGSQPQQQHRSGEFRQPSGTGGPSQGPPQISVLGPQMVSQTSYQRQSAPGDSRGQYQGGPQHPEQQQRQQFQQGQPLYQGPPGTQPFSYGSQGEPDVRHSSSVLKKTLSGVSANSNSTRYAPSTTSSQEKKRSSVFGSLTTKMSNSGSGSQQSPTSPTQSQSTMEPKMTKEAGRRASFMNRGKKDKSDSSKKKDKGKSHKKGFSIDVFGRTGSMLGKLTRSPSPTAGTQYQPPSQPSPQPPQVQSQRQSSENSWTGRQQQSRPHNQSENMVRHASQSLSPGAQGLQGRVSPPAIPPKIPSEQVPQVMSQQQSLTRQSSGATIQPIQQSQQPQQPQYESVPIPTGYGRLQGEYDAGQGQFFHQPTLQQGSRQDYSNVDIRGGGQATIGGRASQVSENRLSIDRHTTSPDLSRQGTQTSRTHETTRSLSPAISDGPPRSMTPASESGQFGRQQSLREGGLLDHQTPVHLSPRPSIREGQGQDSQRHQQPLPFPQSISQVQNSANEYERSPSPRSVPLPVSPPHRHPPFPPPPIQVRSETLASPVLETAKSPPPPPPKEEIERPMNENMQKGKQTKSFYGSGSPENTDTPDASVALPSTPVMISSPAPATRGNPPPPPTQEDKDMGKEVVDFSTEKIAVNLDLHGPGSKKNGDDSEDEYVMSPTAYPGQAWEPSYYGWS